MKDRPFWTVLAVAAALIAGIEGYSRLLQRQRGEAREAYAFEDGTPPPTTIPDYTGPTSATAPILLANNAVIDHNIYSISDNGVVILTIPDCDAPGQECQGKDPRYVDIWLRDGRKVRFDRATGEAR